MAGFVQARCVVYLARGWGENVSERLRLDTRLTGRTVTADSVLTESSNVVIYMLYEDCRIRVTLYTA